MERWIGIGIGLMAAAAVVEMVDLWVFFVYGRDEMDWMGIESNWVRR